MSLRLAVHKTILLVLVFVFSTEATSNIHIDWSLESPDNPVKAYVLEYTPPVGKPQSGVLLSPDSAAVFINETLPATEYTIFITALLGDGTRHNISTKRISSKPEPPTLDSIETSSSETTLSFFPPPHDTSQVSYSIEYHPVDRAEYANFIETRAPLFKIRGLEPSTRYHLRVFSIYRGIRSAQSLESFFTTKDETGSEPVTVKTLPPNFGSFLSQETRTEAPTSSTTAFTSTEIFITNSNEESAVIDTLSSEITVIRRKGLDSTEDFNVPTRTTMSTFDGRELDEESSSYSYDSTTPYLSTTEVPSSSVASRSFHLSTSLLDKATTFPVRTTTAMPTTVEDVTEPIEWNGNEDREKETTPIGMEEEEYETTTYVPSTTTEEVVDRHVEISMIYTTSPQPLPRIVLSSLSLPDPSPIMLSKTEDNLLKLEWDMPTESECDSFRVNSTLLSLDTPKTLSTPTNDNWLQMKMYTGQSIQLEVFCIIAGSASKTWWAKRVADLSKPSTIGTVTATSMTDEFYVSTITLTIPWPQFNDFSAYKLVVAYSQGKMLSSQPKEMDVTETGPIVIEGLEPTKWYTISVRNVSIELELESTGTIVKELTPPIISSQLYPGQIASTSININFDPSDPEQGRFDNYELTFSGNAKNITKKVSKEAAKSFTFTKLIPGKTYNFELFTIFEGKRSRPVTANVTTYPLKVNKLSTIIGRDYALLLWDIENFADNDCRFRVSYTGTAGSGHQTSSTVVLKNKNTYKFSNLVPDTYYTFTVIVIMGMGDAEAESESEMVTVSIPATPPRSVPLLQRQGTRELSVQFENDPSWFSEQNGEVDNFAVIVTEKRELNGDDYELRSWFEVKDDEEWSPYRASPSDYNPFRSSRKKSATFVIGAEDCKQRRLDEPFCNGMLRANVDYFVKIRAYTKEGVAMETDWVSVHGSVDEEEDGADAKEKRLPCHMYLNGCPRKSSSTKQSTSFFQPLLTLLGLIVPGVRLR